MHPSPDAHQIGGFLPNGQAVNQLPWQKTLRSDSAKFPQRTRNFKNGSMRRPIIAKATFCGRHLPHQVFSLRVAFSAIISVFFPPSPPSTTCILQCADFISLSRFEVSLDHQVAFGHQLERTTSHSSRTPRTFQRNIPYLRTKKSRSFTTPLRSMQLFDEACHPSSPPPKKPSLL